MSPCSLVTPLSRRRLDSFGQASRETLAEAAVEDSELPRGHEIEIAQNLRVFRRTPQIPVVRYLKVKF